jgi:hypothetical protein
MSTLLFLASSAAPNPGLMAASLDLMAAWWRTSPLLGAPKSPLAWVHAIWTEWASSSQRASGRRANHCAGVIQLPIFAFRQRRGARYLPELHALSDVK